MVFTNPGALQFALSHQRSTALIVKTTSLRLALAVLVGLIAWLMYLEFGLPAVQYANGHDPLAFQAVLLLLSVCALGIAVQRRLAARRRVPR